MTDEELFKDFWISLRAEEIARKVADPDIDKEANWAAFEDAHISADFEWIANYEGVTLEELEGPLINEARELLRKWRNDEEKTIHDKSLVDKRNKTQKSTGRKTAREVISSVPMASPDDPIYKSGFVVGARRLRNSSIESSNTKPSKKDKP